MDNHRTDSGRFMIIHSKFRKLYSYLKVSTSFWNRFYYFVNSGCLHGIRYLDPRYGTIDRTYWIGVLMTSLVAMILIFSYTLIDYLDSPVVINFEAVNVNKNNIFPALSICIEKVINNKINNMRIENFVQKYYAEHDIEEPQHQDYHYQLMSYIHQMPGIEKDFKELDACDAINSTCGVDIETIKQMLFPYCDELFSNIQFNGKRYHNCADIFKRQIMFTSGVCFIANSVYFYNSNWDKLPLTYNKNQAGTKFAFDIFMKHGYGFRTYLHSPDEFPSYNTGWRSYFDEDLNIEIILQTTQLVNTNDVRDVLIDKRKCRFSNEQLVSWPNNASLSYSFESCLIYAQIQIELELCNCTLHFAPVECKEPTLDKNQYCNYQQMKCIAEKSTRQLAAKHDLKIKRCLPTCTEMQLGPVGYHKKYKVNGYKSLNGSNPTSGITTISVDIQNPAKQLTRSVRFTKLEFVVTIGSIVGLFFGASIISLVEIVHIWILSRFSFFQDTN